MELVLPWSDSNFKGSAVQKEAVYNNLRRVGLPVQRWSIGPQSIQIDKGLKKAMVGVLEKKWQVICSNSVELLQAIAELSPIVFSLSTHDSSVMITTEKLAARFFLDTWGPEDITRADDIAWQAKSSGLLCWFNITQSHPSGERFHSKFADLLLKRKSLGYPAIFLAAYSPAQGKKFDGDSAEFIFNKMSTAIGETAALLVQEAASIFYLEVELKQTELSSIKL